MIIGIAVAIWERKEGEGKQMWQRGVREGERGRLISVSSNWRRCTHLLGVPDSVCWNLSQRLIGQTKVAACLVTTLFTYIAKWPISTSVNIIISLWISLSPTWPAAGYIPHIPESCLQGMLVFIPAHKCQVTQTARSCVLFIALWSVLQAYIMLYQ